VRVGERGKGGGVGEELEACGIVVHTVIGRDGKGF
jgi:hypothetical protein